MDNTRTILILAVEVGEALLQNGAEIYRVNDSIRNILLSYNIQEFDVYVLSNGIFASADENGPNSCSIIRSVPFESLHLGRLSLLNQLTRDLCSHSCTISEAKKRLHESKNAPYYSAKVRCFCCGIGCASFCFLLNSGSFAIMVSFLLGILEQHFLIVLRKKNIIRFFQASIISMFLTSTVLFLRNMDLRFFQNHLHILQDKIIIATIIPVLPGLSFCTSIRDFYNKDYLSGMIHFIDTIITSLSIAVGVSIPLKIFYQFLGG